MSSNENEPRRDRGKGGKWDWGGAPDGLFGTEGLFGAHGPFGPEGPFGPSGPFSPGGPFGGGGRGRHGGAQRHGPGRRRRLFGQGELRLALLKMLADEPRHGYELIKAVEELTEGIYAPSPGAVYPTLQLLADEGMIEERGDDSPRKAYAATAAGLAELETRRDEVERLFDRLSALADEQHGRPHLRVHRAMENLRNAVRLHRHRGALEGETLDRLVDAIDDAARRIERL